MPKTVIVGSVKGGTGKSLVSCSLAWYLNAQDINVGLIDADIESSNFREMAQIDGSVEVDEEKRFVPYDWEGIEVFSMSLLQEEKAVSMSGEAHRRILDDIVHNTTWNSPDVFVVDLPSGASDVFLKTVDMFGDQLGGGIIVLQPMNKQDAVRMVNLHKSNGVPVLGLIENMSYFKVPHGKKRYRPFGDPIAEQLAEKHDVPYLGEIPLSIKIRKRIENGTPIIPNKYSEAIQNAVKQVKQAKTVSIFEKVRKKIKGSVKRQAEKILKDVIMSSNKLVDILKLQKTYGFTDRKPFDIVVEDEKREEVLSRTHLKVKNGTLMVMPEDVEPTFEACFDFPTLARIVVGKKKTRTDTIQYDAYDAWVQDDLEVYGSGSTPRFVKLFDNILSGEVMDEIKSKYKKILSKFI